MDRKSIAVVVLVIAICFAAILVMCFPGTQTESVGNNTTPIQEIEPLTYPYTYECDGICVGDIVEINFSRSSEHGERHVVTEMLFVDNNCRLSFEDGNALWASQVSVLNLTDEERDALLSEKQSDIETILTRERFLALQVGDKVNFTEKARECLYHVDFRFEEQTVEAIDQEYEIITIHNGRWFSRHWFRTSRSNE